MQLATIHGCGVSNITQMKVHRDDCARSKNCCFYARAIGHIMRNIGGLLSLTKHKIYVMGQLTGEWCVWTSVQRFQVAGYCRVWEWIACLMGILKAYNFHSKIYFNRLFFLFSGKHNNVRFNEIAWPVIGEYSTEDRVWPHRRWSTITVSQGNRSWPHENSVFFSPTYWPLATMKSVT